MVSWWNLRGCVAIVTDRVCGRVQRAALGLHGGLCDGGRGQAADRGVPGWDGGNTSVSTATKKISRLAGISRKV